MDELSKNDGDDMATAPKLKTTAKIQNTFIKMLETTAINDITVTEICKSANINRATFYYHYDSVADVYKHIEKRLEDEFERFLAQSLFTDDGALQKNFYVSFFEFVARNANMCRLIINSTRTNTTFLTKALDAGRAKVVTVMAGMFPDCPTSKIEYYYLFVSQGFLGLMSYWLNSGMKETPEEIASVGESVSQRGVMYLA